MSAPTIGSMADDGNPAAEAGSSGHVVGPGIGLTEALARWTAEARTDEAARERLRRRFLRRQAEEEATVAGVLVDLGEQGRPVVVATVDGQRFPGRVAAVGTDFLVLRTERGVEVVVALAAVASVRPRPGAPAPIGDRTVTVRLDLATALAVVADERARVRIVTSPAGEPTAGELASVGHDVAVVRLDGPGRDVVYLPIATVAHVTVEA